MSDMPTVAALLCEQGAALFPVVVSVRNNTPMTLCRTGARIGVAPYASAKVCFASQPELALFIKKVNAQAQMHGDDPKEVYPIEVLQVTTGAEHPGGAGAQLDAALGAEVHPAHADMEPAANGVPPAENLADDGPAQPAAEALPPTTAGDPAGATPQAKRTPKKGAGA